MTGWRAPRKQTGIEGWREKRDRRGLARTLNKMNANLGAIIQQGLQAGRRDVPARSRQLEATAPARQAGGNKGV